MADDRQESSEQPSRSGRGRRRPAPTIELTATEVATEPPAKPEATSEPTASAEPESQVATTAPGPEASPAPEPESANQAAPDEPEAQAADGPPPLQITPWWLLGAVAGGGALVVVLLLLLWGMPAGNDAVTRQAARIAQLETRVQELAGRDASATPDPALADRLTALEAKLGTLTDETAALKSRANANAAAADAAQRSADAAAAKIDTARSVGAQDAGAERQAVASLSERVAALERGTQTLQKELSQQQAALAKQRDTRAEERVVRLAVVAETLKAAVARGEPFRAELDAAKALAADQPARAGHAPPPLAPLDSFADTGVPTTATLVQQLRLLLPQMRRVAQPSAAPDAGFWDRLQANAERLVRIQPVGEQPGDDPSAVLARIEAKLGRGDIAGVLQELKSLPQPVRAPAQDWIKRAQAREAAIAASRQFAAAQIGALAGRSD